MLSCWSDLLTTDGEKDWCDSDAKFENVIQDKKQLMTKWNRGWTALRVRYDS